MSNQDQYEVVYRDVRDGKRHPFVAISWQGTSAELEKRVGEFQRQTKAVTGKTIPLEYRKKGETT